MSDDLLAEGLARVRVHFLNCLYEHFQRINHLRMQITARVNIKESLSEIGHICHKIAGTAATLGFPELGVSAAKVDDLVMARIEGQDDPDPHLLAEIDQLLKATSTTLSSQDRL